MLADYWPFVDQSSMQPRVDRQLAEKQPTVGRHMVVLQTTDIIFCDGTVLHFYPLHLIFYRPKWEKMIIGAKLYSSINQVKLVACVRLIGEWGAARSLPF